MDRVILHCDCNSYFASVECINRPELREVPMAVCGDPEGRRGIILAKNELAKKFGIVTAETVWQALRKCPHLTLVPPHSDQYEEYCRKINAIYGEYTDQVEQFSIDESWLDVTGSQHLFGSGREIADTLRRRIWEELGLTISVGVSFNKMFAKLGSDYKKPDATTVITRENYKQILYPLPVGDMMFVGKAAGEVLHRNYIDTIGDLAATPVERLNRLLGKSGETLWCFANGLDDSPVRRPWESDPVKSVGNSLTFCRDLQGMEDVKAGLMLLCESVGSRLRHLGQMGQTIGISIKDPALKVISRQAPLPGPTQSTQALLTASLGLLCRSWDLSAPIRMLSVTAMNLCSKDVGGYQVSLFPAQAVRQEKQEKLEAVIDGVRRRFGEKAVELGTLMTADILHHREEE